MRAILIVVCSIYLFGCSDPNSKTFSHNIYTFGTLLEVTLAETTPETAEAIFNTLEEDYKRYHERWTPWESTSDLWKINRAIADARSHTPSESLLPLIRLSIDLADGSDGYFNPAIGNLINLWQFHRHDEPDIRPPEDNLIRKLIDADPRMSDIYFEGEKLLSHNTAVQLNFGAIAKGYAIDLSIEKLKGSGIKNAIINAGGDLRVIGSKSKDEPWNIGIRHPREDTVVASIKMRDGESIFTSGDYERYYLYEGERYHHILNPKTGYPTKGFSSVTVIVDNATRADAIATALMVAGPEEWYSVSKKMGVRLALLIKEDNTIIITPELAKRIEINEAQKPHIVLSQPL